MRERSDALACLMHLPTPQQQERIYPAEFARFSDNVFSELLRDDHNHHHHGWGEEKRMCSYNIVEVELPRPSVHLLMVSQMGTVAEQVEVGCAIGVGRC